MLSYSVVVLLGLDSLSLLRHDTFRVSQHSMSKIVFCLFVNISLTYSVASSLAVSVREVTGSIPEQKLLGLLIWDFWRELRRKRPLNLKNDTCPNLREQESTLKKIATNWSQRTKCRILSTLANNLQNVCRHGEMLTYTDARICEQYRGFRKGILQSLS